MKWIKQSSAKWTRDDGAFVVYAGSSSGKKPWQRATRDRNKWRQHQGIYYATPQSAMKAVDAIEPYLGAAP